MLGFFHRSLGRTRLHRPFQGRVAPDQEEAGKFKERKLISHFWKCDVALCRIDLQESCCVETFGWRGCSGSPKHRLPAPRTQGFYWISLPEDRLITVGSRIRSGFWNQKVRLQTAASFVQRPSPCSNTPLVPPPAEVCWCIPASNASASPLFPCWPLAQLPAQSPFAPLLRVRRSQREKQHRDECIPASEPLRTPLRIKLLHRTLKSRSCVNPLAARTIWIVPSLGIGHQPQG